MTKTLFLKTGLIAFVALIFLWSGAQAADTKETATKRGATKRDAPRNSPSETGIEPSEEGVASIIDSEPSADDSAEENATPLSDADQFRSWVVTAHYSYFDFLLPGKKGLAIAHRGSDRSMTEFEYTQGSLSPFFIDEFGKFTEERLTLLRRFTGRDGAGFQWFYGAFYQRFKLEVGNALYSRLSGGVVPSVDIISIGSAGLMIGIGYRWLIRQKFVIGVEGGWAQPLITVSRDTRFLDVVTNSNDRDNLESMVTVVQYFPRFNIAKLSLGYNF